jgi:hypothetical protein
MMLVLEVFVLYLDVDSGRPEEYCWKSAIQSSVFWNSWKGGNKDKPAARNIFFSSGVLEGSPVRFSACNI